MLVGGRMLAILSPNPIVHLAIAAALAVVFLVMVQWRRQGRGRGRPRRLVGGWEVAGTGLICLAVGDAWALSTGDQVLPFAAPTVLGFGLLGVGLLACLAHRYPGRAVHVLVVAIVVITTTAAVAALAGLGGTGWGVAASTVSLAMAFGAVTVAGGFVLTTTERSPAQRLAFLGSFLLAAAHLVLFTSPSTGTTGRSVFTGVALAGCACWAWAGAHRSIEDSFDAVVVLPPFLGRAHSVFVAAVVALNGAVVVAAVRSDASISLAAAGLALAGPATLIASLLTHVARHRGEADHIERDELTGLASRASFEHSLRLAIARARRSGESVAVLFLDLDRFKDVNDSLGHAEGNRLLREAARRINSALRETDTAARFGGDEFAVVCGDLGSGADAVEIATRIVDVFAKPFTLARRDVYVTASLGMSLFPADAEDAESLVTNADAAMYQAKNRGRNTLVVFSPDITEVAKQRVVIKSELHNAIKREELELHYQPKLHLASGRIAGVEALVRWRHPERGLLGPDRFIGVAEEFAMISEIGEWVLEEACRELQKMRASGFSWMTAAVNVSPFQFKGRCMADVVKAVLERTGVEAVNLELELTEGIAIDASDETLADLYAIGRMGVICSIDDFGTGYSSLSYLTRLPFKRLKIDKSFVMRVGASHSSDDAAVIRAIIAMAHSLGLQVVAEGVETEEQLTFLRNQGCDYVQGYLISAPLPADELERFLMLHQVIPSAPQPARV